MINLQQRVLGKFREQLKRAVIPRLAQKTANSAMYK
jgi:hypothetical protein